MQECPECGQTFARPQKLRYHMKLHTGEGLLKCDFCPDKVFTNTHSLKCHLSAVHAVKAKVACAFCNWSGKVLDKLNKHLKEDHPDKGKNCEV